MDDLKPCPFCGSLNVLSRPVEDDPDFESDYDVVMTCFDCGTRGPEFGFKNGIDAIAAWNRRAQEGEK